MIKSTLIIVSCLAMSFMAFGKDADRTVGLFRNESGAFKGYTLFTPRHYDTTYLIDMEGRCVHKWKAETRVENAKLLDNGLLLRMVNLKHRSFNRTPGPHGKVELVDWDGEVTWSFTYATEKHVLHHDVVPLPNGNFLMSTFDVKTKQEAIAAGRDPKTIPGDRLLVERIIEVKPTGKKGGEIVWSWCVWDHLIQDFDKNKPNYGQIKDYIRRFNLNYFRRPNDDWNHVSGLAYNPERDEILITFHGNDEIVVIDHSTTMEEAATDKGGKSGHGGEILYRFGNPQTYGHGTSKDKRYMVIHNAYWIPEKLPDSGSIMLLHNNYRGKNSTVEALDIPLTNGKYVIPQKGKNAGMPKIKIVYEDFHTKNMGGAQRLPNGNTLIDDAVHGRFIEVTPSKRVVWEYVSPVTDKGPLWKCATVPVRFGGDQSNECFRVTRLAPDFPGLKDRDLTAGKVIEKLEPPENMEETKLTKEQQKKYDAIMKKYQSKMRDVFRSAMGNRQEIGKGMQKLNREQNSEMRELLNDSQFNEYMKEQSEKRNQRRSQR